MKLSAAKAIKCPGNIPRLCWKLNVSQTLSYNMDLRLTLAFTPVCLNSNGRHLSKCNLTV